MTISIHTVEASLYKAFPPEEARKLLNRLEIHHTPKHGSWQNNAELELAALSRQCLDAYGYPLAGYRRIPDLPTLQSEIAAWNAHRNKNSKSISWQFTTQAARTKLKRLYPVFSD